MRTHFRDQVFDRPRHADKNAQGPGIYLTTDKDEASGYAGTDGKLHTVTLKPNAKIVDYEKPAPRGFLQKLIKLAPKENRETGFSNWDENPHIALKRALDSYSQEDHWLQGTMGIYHDFFGSNPDPFVKANIKAGVDGVRVGRHLVVYNPEILMIQKHEATDLPEVELEEFHMSLFQRKNILNKPLSELVKPESGINPDTLSELQQFLVREALLEEIDEIIESQMVKHYFDFKKMKGGVAKKTGERTDDARKVSNHPTILAISQKLRLIWGQLERESSRKERFKMVAKQVGPALSRYMKSIPEGAYGKRDSGSTTDQEKFDDEEPRQKKDKKRRVYKRSARGNLDVTNVFPAAGGPLDLAYEEVETDETDEADLTKLAGMMAQRGRKTRSRKKGKSALTGSYTE